MSEMVTFSIIALFLVVSPGPNIALILKTVSSRGQNAGFLNISGFVLAAFIHGTFSILGLSAIIVQSAELFLLVKIIGSLYLLYLGVKTIYQSFKQKASKIYNTLAITKTNQSSIKSFSEGFLTQMLNPKGSIFYLSVFPQFIDFQSHAYFEAFALVSIHTGLMIIWFGFICLMISKIKLLDSKSKIGCWVQRISGSILLVFSILLLQQEVKN